MNTMQTRSILSRKHSLWQAAPCSLTYMSLLSVGDALWEKANVNMGLFLDRAKHFLKNQENAFGEKAGMRNTVTTNSYDYCKYITLKEKEWRVTSLFKWLISKDFSSSLNNRGTGRRHSISSYTALLWSPDYSGFGVSNQQWQSRCISPVHRYYF